jgi:hypothetical protein
MSLGSGIRDPDPGVKKAPDPGSGSATLTDTNFVILLKTSDYLQVLYLKFFNYT